MTAVSASLRGRILAEALMTSTCTVRARGDGVVTDPDTWEVVPAVGQTLYSGKCRAKPGGGGAQDVGGGETFVYDFEIQIPFDAPKIPRGAIAVVDDSPDAWLVGARGEVADVRGGDFGNKHQLFCREAT